MRHVKAVAVVFVPVAVAVLYVWRPFHEPFTRERWVEATPQVRDRLLAELADSGILLGLTEEEVYDLLGEPDGGSDAQAVYEFRHEGRSRPCLIFRFNGGERVESQRLSSMEGTTSLSRFEAETWRFGTPADRLSMVRDLVASHSLEGMHRDELYALLGDPDRETPIGPSVWYTRRYYDPNGEIRKRHAGASKCLYINFRDGRIESAAFKGS